MSGKAKMTGKKPSAAMAEKMTGAAMPPPKPAKAMESKADSHHSMKSKK